VRESMSTCVSLSFSVSLSLSLSLYRKAISAWSPCNQRAVCVRVYVYVCMCVRVFECVRA